MVARAQTTSSTTEGRLDPDGLLKILEGMGYEPKNIGTEKGAKYEFKVSVKGFDIPVGAELSGSRNYIWLTVLLKKDSSKANHLQLLKHNAKIQPCQFYVTDSGALMMAIAVDNRAVTPAVIKRTVELLSDSVSKTAETWNVAGD